MKTTYPTIPIPHIAEREEALSKIPRYNLYHVMYYRSSILNHSIRTWLIVKELLPYATKAFGNSFDTKKAETLALIHDDIEIVIGDIQAGNKSKMTKVQLQQVYNQEQQAIIDLSQKFPKMIGDYNYKDMLSSAINNDCLEAKLVQYADKLDAFGEALHEIFGGNVVFATAIKNQYGKIPTPIEYYMSYFKKFLNKYPQMKTLFKTDLPISLIPKDINFINISKNHQPHTIETINNNSNYPHYDFWKNIILKNQDIIPTKYLYTQIETKQ